MAKNCEECTEKCPQAEMAHQAALGRMYATNELVALLKKVESGELVEVVRCRECAVPHNKWTGCPNLNGLIPPPEHFCARGERRNNHE